MVGSDLLMRSLREVATTATGALFLTTDFFLGCTAFDLTAALGITALGITALGLAITFGFETGLGFATGLGTAVALGPLPLRASKIN